MLNKRLLLLALVLFSAVFTAIGEGNESDREHWIKRINVLTREVGNNIDSIQELANHHFTACPLGKDEAAAYYQSFMAEVYYYMQDLDNSLKAYQASLRYFGSVNDSSRFAVLYNNIGLIHYLRANYDSALVAYSHSLEHEKYDGNKEGIAQSYQNLGIIYGKWERYDQVYEYYNNALLIYDELGNHSAAADVNNNIAVIALRMQDSEKAFHHYKKAYDAFSAIGDEQKMATVATNLGRLFATDRQYNRAQEYFDAALKVFTSLDDKIGLVHTYSMLGEMYQDRGMVNEAIEAYEQANFFNRKVGLREVQLDNLNELYEVYRQLGKYELANNVLEQSYALKDSIYNQEQLEKLIALEKRYHAEKGQKELVILKAKEERTRMYMWGISLFFLLLTVIVLIWVYVLKIKEKQRRLSMEQKVLRTQMNPHFIFNSLSALQCIIMENNKEDAIDFVADFSGLMRLVLQYAKEEHITLKKEKEILDRYMSLQNRRFDHQINYKIEFDEHIELENVLVPPMLTQPFLENAIEHGQLNEKNSYIHVNLRRKDDKLEFSVEDNGIGIKSSLAKGKGKKHKHKSLAVSLTHERLSLLNNKENRKDVTLKIEDLSAYGLKGTRVVFQVPFMTLN
ncbi:tetratricopeptide repeat protein [Carboxylicivirga mesophila]|uniref:Tetratricopeptide repeat protein n=1 Tax=Carboxylicivirga mesophila TaxID=1166478 RepID=A0ABS5K5S1_9BACT|nr:tetratricopeptide repeat protein [Carboxylicivirga mesophila]MBS2210344.1 tetratricopeptide repeat protein [Carboxylicivirga mesophila]